MAIKHAISDHKHIAYTFPSATAVAIGDLLYNNSGVAAKASAQSDGGTEAANQATFAALFLGVSADQRLSTETGTAERVVITDGIFDCTCPSTTWAVGDLVGPSENSGGDGLENQQVEKVTVATRAIGYCVKPGTSLTTVRCRLISYYMPNVVYRGNLDATLADDVPLILGTGGDVNLLWSTGDASNHALVLGLGDSNQALHITDLAAIATDWNISATTDPNVYIHSNTTPATDYLRIGGHTGTVADIDVVGGTTLQLQIAGTSEVTMTATQLNVLDGNSLLVGDTSLRTISDGDGSTNLTPTAQILGTTKADGSLLLMVNSATATSAAAPSVNLVKSAHATLGSNTVVTSGEVLGEVNFFGADGTDFESCAVSIRGLVNTTPGTGDMPGRLSIFTSTDGAETPTERVRVTGTATASTLALGIAGATTGTLTLAGTTSGVVTIQALAAAGTYTLSLPPDDGDAGEQLQTDGSGVMTWEAAGSLREVKEVIEELSGQAEQALERLCGAGVYAFRYLHGARPTTGDRQTVYTGVMADEMPEVMHHQGRIFSPVSAFGQSVLAIKALAARVARLESASAS